MAKDCSCLQVQQHVNVSIDTQTPQNRQYVGLSIALLMLLQHLIEVVVQALVHMQTAHATGQEPGY